VTTREVLAAALALPPKERAQLIEELEASMPQVEDDDAFIDMINERVAESEAGAPAYPAEEVFARLRTR
jgi:putative addiction module component (TIGR02574 family)